MDTLQAVRNLEAELAAKRREVSETLRANRDALGLTLIQVASRVRISPAQIHNIENSRSWKTKTVARIARFYERQLAA